MEPSKTEIIELSGDSESESESESGETDEDQTDDDDSSSTSSGSVVILFTSTKRNLNRKEDSQEYLALKKKFDLKELSVIVKRLPPASTNLQTSAEIPVKQVKRKRKRRKKSDPSNFIYQCTFPDCPVKFCSEDIRDAHYKRKHEGIKRPYKCARCGMSFPFPSSLAEHENLHDGKFPFQCPDCPEKFATRWNLKKHRQKVHEPGSLEKLCEHCGKSVSGPSSYKRHIRLHFPHLAIPCDICGKRFTATRDMKRHRANIHEDDPQNSFKSNKEGAKCQYCSKTFSSKSYLLMHERTHTGEHELSCEICGYKTSAQSILKVHMLCHSEDRDLSCDVCSYTCKTVARLNDHKRTVHTEDRNFLCTFCGMSFKNKNNWLGHEEIHKNDDNEIVCPICSRGFKVRRYLISHFRHAHKYFGKIPDDIGQITAETLLASTGTPCTDNGEVPTKKVEGDIRNYTCSFCGKTFKYKNNWASHELLHSNGDQTFICSLCGQSFKVQRYLTYHLRRVHKIQGKIPKTSEELAQLAQSISTSEDLNLQDQPVTYSS